MNQSLIIFITAITCISPSYPYIKRIDEGEYVTIGGIQQFLYHRGENKDHPVVFVTFLDRFIIKRAFSDLQDFAHC